MNTSATTHTVVDESGEFAGREEAEDGVEAESDSTRDCGGWGRSLVRCMERVDGRSSASREVRCGRSHRARESKGSADTGDAEVEERQKRERRRTSRRGEMRERSDVDRGSDMAKAQGQLQAFEVGERWWRGELGEAMRRGATSGHTAPCGECGREEDVKVSQ